MASELHAQGYPVLAIIGPDEWLVGKLQGAGVPVQIMEFYVGARPKMLRSLGRLRKIMRTEEVQTLVTWSFTTHLLGAMAGPERLLPNVRGLVYDWATARRRMLWRRVIAPRAERILCVSRSAEETVCGCAPAAEQDVGD